MFLLLFLALVIPGLCSLQVHHDGEFRRWTFLLYLNDVDSQQSYTSSEVSVQTAAAPIGENTYDRDTESTTDAEYEHQGPSFGETWFPVLGLKVRPRAGRHLSAAPAASSFLCACAFCSA